MERYLTELHAHTRETSRCAKDKAKNLVENYLQSGYSTLVTTDHFSPSTFEAYKDIPTFLLPKRTVQDHPPQSATSRRAKSVPSATQ